MPILKKKCKEFPNKTPIFFETLSGANLNIHEIKEGRGHWHPKLEDKLNLNQSEVNWSQLGSGYATFINSYGLIFRNKIIAIALRDDISGKLEIYCDNYYFETNSGHKKYINKFARELNMSVRKDIFYIETAKLASWTTPFEVGLEFYEEETQSKITEQLFDKLKLKYPNIIANEELEVPVECLAC